MKRNMDKVREILFALENSDGQPDLRPLLSENFTERDLGYHQYLIHEAGLAEGIAPANGALLSHDDFPYVILTHLNNAGHDFLDLARDSTRWDKAKQVAAEKAGGLTIAVLTQVLGAFAKLGVEAWMRGGLH